MLKKYGERKRTTLSDIQKSTADAPDTTDTAFPGFQLVAIDQVTKALLSSPNKQSATDILPTWLLKDWRQNWSIPVRQHSTLSAEIHSVNSNHIIHYNNG